MILTIVMLGLGLAGLEDDRVGVEQLPARLSVRLHHPEEELAHLLALFDGAKAPHPAAALAGYRRANGGVSGLSKSTEALIAFLNPETASELSIFDGAELRVLLGGANGRIHWSATIPRDDGTLAGVATALALTDGLHEEAIGGLPPADRLGPPGSPWMTVDGPVVRIAGARDDLRGDWVAERLPAEDRPVPVDSGIAFTFTLGPLDKGWPLPLRQAAAFVEALGVRDLRGTLRTRDTSLRAEVVGNLRVEGEPWAGAAIEPAWLDLLPTDRAVAIVAVGLDPRSASWNRLFGALDRAVQEDPTQATAAPLRTRLALLGLPVGVRPEADLWPKLRGVGLGIYTDRTGWSGVTLALHATDASAAETIARRVIPRLASTTGLRPTEEDGHHPDGREPPIGRWQGWPLRVVRTDSTVIVWWGNGPQVAGAPDLRPRSPSAWIGPLAAHESLHRLAVVWPGRWPDPPWAGTLLEAGLRDAEPIVWIGGPQGGTATDRLEWAGLDRVVRHGLETLPIALPPQTRPFARDEVRP